MCKYLNSTDFSLESSCLSNLNYSLDFELNENDYLPNLFGVDDKNIQIIEKINNVQIKYRGNKIKIIGD